MVHYLLLSVPWSVQCYYAEELQLRVPLQVRGSPGTGDSAPSTPGDPALCDRLGSCLLWVSDGVCSLLDFQWTQQFPVTGLVPRTVMGSHLIPLPNFSSTPSPLSLGLKEQAPVLRTAQVLAPAPSS